MQLTEIQSYSYTSFQEHVPRPCLNALHKFLHVNESILVIVNVTREPVDVLFEHLSLSSLFEYFLDFGHGNVPIFVDIFLFEYLLPHLHGFHHIVFRQPEEVFLADLAVMIEIDQILSRFYPFVCRLPEFPSIQILSGVLPCSMIRCCPGRRHRMLFRT